MFDQTRQYGRQTAGSIMRDTFNFSSAKAISLGWLFVLVFAVSVSSQTIAKTAAPAQPSVTKIDEKQFASLIKPNGKPLLINFWATWCTPCIEEFPDLVKVDYEFKGKIDFIIVSLDFEEELATGVPKFLRQMKATMPSYLLITPDETAAIASVSKDWAGGLPFTVLFASTGELAYSHQGIVKLETLRAEINKILPKTEVK